MTTAQTTYSYRAREKSGTVVTGTMLAESPEEVGSKLRAEGKYVLMVEDKRLNRPERVDSQMIRRTETSKRVRREDVIALCMQLSIMLETGVPLSEALDAFRRQSGRKEFQQVLEVMTEEICSGEEFSTVMSRWPRVFPPLVVSLMRASEASGTMAIMLGRIGDYLSRERKTVRQLKGAITYPLLMMITGLAMTIFLMVVVLPRFASIYAMRSATLPLPTQVLLSISEFMTGQWQYYVPAVAVIGSLILVWRKSSGGRRVFDWLRLELPILGPMFRQLYITRFTRTMATLLASGVSVLDIIDICRGVTRNVYYDDLWDAMEDGVRNGKQISDAINDCPYIPPQIASMIIAGERSGRLPEVMGRVSEFSEEELDSAVKQTTSYIEPIMIIAMGIMIGGVAMALLLPIFSMGKVVAGG